MSVGNGAHAALTLRPPLHYRREVFAEGLGRIGYAVGSPRSHPQPADLLVLWNRNRAWEHLARVYEQAGARVIVAENGYLGRDAEGGQLYAMALRQHNGAGVWPSGDDCRWDVLGIELAPWRTGGEEIVVLPQRGIGAPGVAMPRSWATSVVTRLRKVTRRPVRIRPHPGKDRPDPAADLEHAFAAVTWGSGAGLKAIVHGVPVFHELRAWIGATAARYGIDDIENPFRGDRLPMLRRLAWAQWTLEEIRSGAAFAALLASSSSS